MTTAIVLGIIVSMGLVLSGRGSGSRLPTYASRSSTNPSSLPGIQTGPAPWRPEYPGLPARLAADGLPPLTQDEGAVLHVHEHLDIFVRGHRVPIPQSAGIVTSPAELLGTIHTHDATAVIHVESPVTRQFTLGELFDTWGVRFTAACLGGYCSNATESLRIFSDGHPVSGDPRQLVLTERQEILISFGTPAQVPHPIPSSYGFSSGL